MYSDWFDFDTRVYQDSIVGPLLFNVNRNVYLLQCQEGKVILVKKPYIVQPRNGFLDDL